MTLPANKPAKKGKVERARKKTRSKRAIIERAMVLAAGANVAKLSTLMEATIDDALSHEDDKIRLANRKIVFDHFVGKMKTETEDKGDPADNTLVIKIGTVQMGENGVARPAIEGEFTVGEADGG